MFQTKQEKRSPQHILDDIHAVDVPVLFNPKLSTRQRAERLQRAQTELDGIHIELEGILESIQKAHKRNKNKDEHRIERAPYTKLDELVNELISAVKDLAQRVKANKLLPQGFVFGDAIFGNKEAGEWHIGSFEDAQRWEDMQRMKNRLQDVREESIPLQKRMKELRDELGTRQKDLKTLMTRYKKRNAKGTGRIRTLILGLFALVGMGAGGALIATDPDNIVIGGLALAIGIMCLTLIFVLNRRRKSWLSHTRETIQEERKTVQSLKSEGKKLRRHLIPLKQMIEEIELEYKSLRATF